MNTKRVFFWVFLVYLGLIPIFFLVRAYTLYVNPTAFYTEIDMGNADAWLAVKTLAARHVGYCFIVLAAVIMRRKTLLITAIIMVILVSIQDGLILFNDPFIEQSQRVSDASIELFNIIVMLAAMLGISRIATNERDVVQLNA